MPKKIIISLLLPLLALVNAGCATMTDDQAGEEPVLFNPVINAGALEVSVVSHGCTKAEHFYLIVRGDEIELRRTEPDFCRAAPKLVRFAFEYEFGDAAYEFKNEVRYANRVTR
ncbi:hypothetical protein [Reinekea marinisedimentorum]|uniref:Lipoprotein n=1 Tax=Reinekea marinisedimentorum TaxID=230495 RepID=A0A4R3I8N6_9GAMM|nr:hypothetical protein [Reinekea marinisedimentorum]TCS41659.1 hypothetical protein BCF53_10586 [Reinekea marinisedimentorum]